MMLIIKNGEYVDNSDISVINFSLHYGVAIFEGIRSYQLDEGYHVVKLREHIERLFDSAKIIQRPITRYSVDNMVNQVIDLVEKSETKDLYIRPIVIYGDGIMGIRNLDQKENIWILSWDWDLDRDSKRYTEGLSVGLSNIKKCSQFSQAKIAANYLPSFVAINSSKSINYDEVILLDDEGYVCETSAQNIFFVKDGEIYTPTLRGALNGITRKLIISQASSIGIKTHFCDIKPNEIDNFSETFVSGTACEIVPIHSIENCVYKTLQINSITNRLSNSLLSYFYRKE
ncbi:MAG: aminotransferase class IV [Ectothiorhodospiraceae bacterium]|nr:aminotransferase class IV [Ectothiorhodospiraceae bacterium]